MTELAQQEDRSLDVLDEYRSAIVDWANDAHHANRVAQSLANTTFVPQSMRGKPAEITAAILTGQEIGLSPMSALRSIDVIQGTPAMRAHAIRGLVQSQGHEVWIEDATDTRVIVAGKRKGSSITQRTEWSIDRAKQLGLMGEDNWKKQPRAMLIARATSELCRLIASDVLLGLPYSSEELSDDLPADQGDAGEAPKSRKRVARRASVPTEEPSVEETSEPDPVDLRPPMMSRDLSDGRLQSGGDRAVDPRVCEPDREGCHGLWELLLGVSAGGSGVRPGVRAGVPEGVGSGSREEVRGGAGYRARAGGA